MAFARIRSSVAQRLPRSVPTFPTPVDGLMIAKVALTLLGASQKLRAERGPVKLRASQVDLINFASVGDILERIRIQHNEVGFLTCRHRAHAGQSENPRVHGRRRLNRFRRRKTTARVVGDLLVRAEAVAGPVGSESDNHTGIMNSLNVATVKLVSWVGGI